MRLRNVLSHPSTDDYTIINTTTSVVAHNKHHNHNEKYHDGEKLHSRVVAADDSPRQQHFTKKNKCTIYKFMKDLLKRKLANPRTATDCEGDEPRYIEVIIMCYFFFIFLKAFLNDMRTVSYYMVFPLDNSIHFFLVSTLFLFFKLKINFNIMYIRGFRCAISNVLAKKIQKHFNGILIPAPHDRPPSMRLLLGKCATMNNNAKNVSLIF